MVAVERAEGREPGVVVVEPAEGREPGVVVIERVEVLEPGVAGVMPRLCLSAVCSFDLALLACRRTCLATEGPSTDD